MRRKLLFVGIAVLAVVLAVTGILLLARPKPGQSSETGSTPGETQVQIVRDDKLIGICVPSQDQVWLDAGALLENTLAQRGYRVAFSWGDGTAQGQGSAMRSLIYQGVAALITVPVDSATLGDTAREAQKYNVPVISYGSLLMDSDAVRGHVCFDYEKMGLFIASHVIEKLGLETAAAEGRSHTVELFMGAPEDYNALSFHKGIYAGLKKHLDAGVLRILSDRVTFEDTCVIGWSAERANQLCASRLNAYGDTAPDAIICASDAIATGVIQALTNKGCSPESWPLITGNGATPEGIAMLKGGTLSVTVKTDPQAPTTACAELVDMVLLGLTPSFQTVNIFNNAVDVPTALCDFTLVE